MDIGNWIYNVMYAGVGWMLIGVSVGFAISMVAHCLIRLFGRKSAAS